MAGFKEFYDTARRASRLTSKPRDRPISRLLNHLFASKSALPAANVPIWLPSGVTAKPAAGTTDDVDVSVVKV